MYDYQSTMYHQPPISRANLPEEGIWNIISPILFFNEPNNCLFVCLSFLWV